MAEGTRLKTMEEAMKRTEAQLRDLQQFEATAREFMNSTQRIVDESLDNRRLVKELGRNTDRRLDQLVESARNSDRRIDQLAEMMRSLLPKDSSRPEVQQRRSGNLGSSYTNRAQDSVGASPWQSSASREISGRSSTGANEFRPDTGLQGYLTQKDWASWDELKEYVCMRFGENQETDSINTSEDNGEQHIEGEVGFGGLVENPVQYGIPLDSSLGQYPTRLQDPVFTLDYSRMRETTTNNKIEDCAEENIDGVSSEETLFSAPMSLKVILHPSSEVLAFESESEGTFQLVVDPVKLIRITWADIKKSSHETFRIHSAPKLFEKMPEKKMVDVDEIVELLNILGDFYGSIDSCSSFVFDPGKCQLIITDVENHAEEASFGSFEAPSSIVFNSGKSIEFPLHNGRIRVLSILVFDPGIAALEFGVVPPLCVSHWFLHLSCSRCVKHQWLSLETLLSIWVIQVYMTVVVAGKFLGADDAVATNGVLHTWPVCCCNY